MAHPIRTRFIPFSACEIIIISRYEGAWIKNVFALGKNNDSTLQTFVATNCRLITEFDRRRETTLENDGVINRVRDSRGLIGVSDERQLIECQENRVRFEDIN